MAYNFNSSEVKTEAQKKKHLDKGFGITEEMKQRAVAVDYVIDVNKKSPKNSEPKMTD